MAILSEMGSATGKGDIISARRVLAKRLKVSKIVCVVIECVTHFMALHRKHFKY
jgi:hypothetical protein